MSAIAWRTALLSYGRPEGATRRREDEARGLGLIEDPRDFVLLDIQTELTGVKEKTERRLIQLFIHYGPARWGNLSNN
jgi:hypothetical protein